MPVNKDAYFRIRSELDPKQVTLVAVSKSKPLEDILELYRLGHRDFGENYVQEMLVKAKRLPPDIRWHFIGHLQTNKVKPVVPHVQLIQAVDSLRLLKEINKQGEREQRVLDCLLQLYIADEETKFGLDEQELNELIRQLPGLDLKYASISGLMGMASLTGDKEKVRKEFRYLKKLFDRYSPLMTPDSRLPVLSMGMSSDYQIAVEEGSTMVRIGSLIFGERI